MRHSAAFGALAGAGAPLALNLTAIGNAAAQSAGDYRALVCVFLFGGNDAYNMVLPT
ncbi:MAG: Tat pathway signal protein, partial [Burkholderiaceae bacterium]